MEQIRLLRLSSPSFGRRHPSCKRDSVSLLSLGLGALFAFMVALGLSGCMPTGAERPEVILVSDGLFGKSWEFKSSSGDRQPMMTCPSTEGIFSKSCVQTGGGSVRFEWYEWAGEVEAPTLTIGGRSVGVSCHEAIPVVREYKCYEGET